MRQLFLEQKEKIMKVFIANDSPIICERIIEMLSEIPKIEIIGYALTAPLAIDSIEKLKPDAVILDIMMPEGSGIDILKKIKKDNPNTIVLIFTNYPRNQYYKKCMELGANYFFDKTSEFNKLGETLKDLIKKS